MTRKLYTSRQVDVSFDGAICEHSGVCTRGMPEVFDVDARPWINPSAAWTPEAAEMLIELVGRCPSGSLVIERPEQKARVTQDEVAASHAPDKSRYEVYVDGELAGWADYALTDGLITFTHTEIDPAFEGRGAGSALVRFALDDVRDTGERKVLPICPFVKGWMGRHPEYQELLYGYTAS